MRRPSTTTCMTSRTKTIEIGALLWIRSAPPPTTTSHCRKKGDQQVDYLKAGDFVDTIGPNMRMYNVRRAKTRWDDKKGRHCSCGLAHTSKMWRRPDDGAWRWICQVGWEQVIEEQRQYPAGGLLKEWVDLTKRDHGDDDKLWPKIGCDSTFVPNRTGASMVVATFSNRSQQAWSANSRCAMSVGYSMPAGRPGGQANGGKPGPSAKEECWHR